MRVLLGFDFYGSGNIGDDLTLGGFAAALPASGLTVAGFPAFDPSTQARRFPMIEWHPGARGDRARILAAHDCWAGVGDTPFQLSSGCGMLEQILADLQACERLAKPMYMLGVGCEREVLADRRAVIEIVRRLEHVWTRDDASRELLVDHGAADPQRVTAGSDLAHITLQGLFPLRTGRGAALGVNYYAESPRRGDAVALRRFLAQVGPRQPVVFFCQETRPKGFDLDAYRRIRGGWRPWRRRLPVGLQTPDYASGGMPDLVEHFRSYDIVMSSRYHALLAAAWAGCRVVGLGRGSKLEICARELGVPLVTSPFTEPALLQAYAEAQPLPRERLEASADRARKSVDAFLQRLRAAA